MRKLQSKRNLKQLNLSQASEALSPWPGLLCPFSASLNLRDSFILELDFYLQDSCHGLSSFKMFSQNIGHIFAERQVQRRFFLQDLGVEGDGNLCAEVARCVHMMSPFEFGM